jgi:hypothetical protein
LGHRYCNYVTVFKLISHYIIVRYHPYTSSFLTVNLTVEYSPVPGWVENLLRLNMKVRFYSSEQLKSIFFSAEVGTVFFLAVYYCYSAIRGAALLGSAIAVYSVVG